MDSAQRNAPLPCGVLRLSQICSPKQQKEMLAPMNRWRISAARRGCLRPNVWSEHILLRGRNSKISKTIDACTSCQPHRPVPHVSHIVLQATVKPSSQVGCIRSKELVNMVQQPRLGGSWGLESTPARRAFLLCPINISSREPHRSHWVLKFTHRPKHWLRQTTAPSCPPGDLWLSCVWLTISTRMDMKSIAGSKHNALLHVDGL